MPRFAAVATTGQIPAERCRLVTVDDEEIALWHLGDGRFCAIRNSCPHQHFSKLHEGTLEGEMLSCPMHGWTFSLVDGSEKEGRGKAKVYPVQVEGDQILIGKPD
ncbi:MAG: Rieske 2Fe-2S domain-containing protein [Ignavibacteria bacterium]|nr:Rieske 2Fe-2S domain-containing protein [Ignavibacteria bacterium]